MKKKVLSLSIFTLICLFMVSNNVYAYTCYALGTNAPIDDSIVNLVHTIIVALEIAVPIILVILGMIDFLKGIIAQKEDEIKKGQQTFIKRIIAAVIFFLVIAIVKFVVNVIPTNGTDVWSCADAFINGVR